MMKNRNVHSLCLVLRQGASTASLPSSLEESTSSSAQCVGRLGLNPRANSYPPQLSANTPSSHVLSADSLSFALRSRSAIFKAGVITPITPNFSPAARGHHEDHQQHTSCETKVNGKSDMQVPISRCSPLGCGTPVSLDEKSPTPWQNGGVVPQTQPYKLERQTYASLSNLPTPPPSDSPLSPVLFPEVSGEDLQDPDVLG